MKLVKPRIQLTTDERDQLGEFEHFLLIQPTWLFEQLLRRHEKFINLFTGNQWGKNVNIVKQYVMRWLGIHPIDKKNLHPYDEIRTYRLCSETLPTDKDATEDTKNTIYPVVKRMLPSWMILGDVSQRDPVLTIKDIQGGDPIQIEFSSYGQSVQRQAGKQRAAVWIDENCSREFYSEQLPRLLASNGDLITTMTPALGQITWQYDDMYAKAHTIIRTPLVAERFNERFGVDVGTTQITESKEDIVVLMAATDDNPHYDTLVAADNERTLELIKRKEHLYIKNVEDFKPMTKAEYIRGTLGLLDPESEDVRRFGIFRKISGTIFKDYDSFIHYRSYRETFPGGIPAEWLHARGIDYHPHVPWHYGACVLSPENEMFIYDELVVSPDNYVTLEIADQLANKQGQQNFSLDLVDPLAAEKQPNTGTSPLEDLNRIFWQFKKSEKCAGAYWASWDTKSLKGRDDIKQRLKNSLLCGKPFNNNGLPTLWVLDTCPVADEYMRKWRWKEWTNRAMLETNDEKNEAEQKYSHMNMVWEAILKHPGFKVGRGRSIGNYPHRNTYGNKMRSMERR